MQIHVVRNGQSIWKISQHYNIPMQKIVEINALEAPDQLAIGQTLLIPLQNRYSVHPGNSPFSIERKTGVSFKALQNTNPKLEGPYVYPGQSLIVLERVKTSTIVNAFAAPSSKTVAIAGRAAEALSWLSFFSYHVDENGNLSTLDDRSLLQVAMENKVKPILTITNIKEGEGFDTEIATAILSSKQVQTTLIDNLLQLMKAKEYAGVNVDFEYLGLENKERYNQFLRQLTKDLKPQGYLVTTSVPPKTDPTQEGVLYEGHDFKAHGDIVDFVILMTYEWGYGGGPTSSG